MDYFTRYFDSTNIPNILFQVGDDEKNYKEVNVVLSKEMKNND